LALIAPAVNLLVVPLVAPAMAAGLVAMVGGWFIASGVPPAVGMILAAPGWVALRVIIGIVELAAAMPLASVSFDPPVGVALAIGTMAVAAGVLAWRRRRWAWAGRSPVTRPAHDERRPAERRPTTRPMRIAVGGLIAAVSVAGAVAISRPVGVARVTVLDIGQGDAILVARRSAARRRRTRSRPPPGRARSADPTVGPSHRRPDPQPPA
jgi:hypothetical protein